MYHSSPFIRVFAFHGFNYLWSTTSENIKWKIPERNNWQVLNCSAFGVAWWNLARSCSILPRCESFLCPESPRCRRSPSGGHLVAAASLSDWLVWQWYLEVCSAGRLHCERVCIFLKFKQPVFYLKMAPKRETRDAGNSGTPKRSRKVLPLNEKVGVPDLIRHLTSSQQEWWVQYQLFWERNHIHVTFITVQCYNCSILLLSLISYCT